MGQVVALVPEEVALSGVALNYVFSQKCICSGRMYLHELRPLHGHSFIFTSF